MTTNHTNEFGISGRTVDLLLNAAFGGQTSIAKYEGLCAGDPMATASGAVVCYAPTVDILRRAAAEGRNLIISREHPLYLHGGLSHAYLSEGLLRDDPVIALGPGGTDRDLISMHGLDGDPIVKAKRRIISDNHLVIYRQGAAWDNFRPAAQSAALARALGMHVPQEQEASRRRGVVCDLAKPSTMSALANAADVELSGASPRIVGDSGLVVHRAAVLAGETDPVESLAELLSDASIDCVITGAGGIMDEVDGGISYFLDLMGTDRRIAMLTVGYGPSHEPGVREMAESVRRATPELDVEYWPSDDPSWVPDVADREERA